MKNHKSKMIQTAHNIIPLHLNAEFYFQRGMRSLDRYHYEKALRYFRRAAQAEPDNAVHHINLAGVLSETGDFEASNEILEYVLEVLDPNLTECHFYMANNYLNMDDLEASERALLDYLELDEQGLYLEEAEEMLELLSMELGRPVKVRGIRSRSALFEHDQARIMLEEGRFSEAIYMLEKLTERYPDFLAARNNLALAYYYTGQLALATEIVQEVLQDDPGNLHALCNLLIFKLQQGLQEEVERLASRLKKLTPLSTEHSFKLATTMGIIGEHEHAYRLFRRMLRTGMHDLDASIYHYTAVAASHLGKLHEARKLWLQVKKLDPGAAIADYYLQQLDEAEESGDAWKIAFSYTYHLPIEEQFKQLELTDRTIAEHLRRDPVIRSSFNWVLRFGDHDTKLQVIQAMGLIGDSEVESVLREFVQRPEEHDDLKRAAILVLNAIGATGPYRAVIDGQSVELQGSLSGLSLPAWEQTWQDVVEIALCKMEHRYDMVECSDMQTLWAEYLNRSFPDTPQIRRPEGWSAALEYLIAKMHQRQMTYVDVAAIYGVSAATVRRHVAKIDEVCGLREKMEAIFPQLGGRL